MNADNIDFWTKFLQFYLSSNGEMKCDFKKLHCLVAVYILYSEMLDTFSMNN